MHDENKEEASPGRPRPTHTSRPKSLMLRRPFILTTLLGASIGVPYVVSQTPDGMKLGDWWPFSPSSHSSTTKPEADGMTELPRLQLTGPGSLVYGSSAPLEGMRFHRLGEVLRFDLTREWVYRNWARKSTGLADPEMFGVRVALVTGTGMSDLAGSLTYQFNRQGQVQRISFLGRTADTAPLVKFLVDTYKFQRVEALAGEQLYQIRRGGRVQSELRTRPESVLWSTSPHGSFSVELELERPGSNRYLPSRIPRLEFPEVASAAIPTPGENYASAAGESGEEAGDEPGLFGKIRPATNAEEAQGLWKRWP